VSAIHEKKEMRNKKQTFHDRFEAGDVLGRMMMSKYEHKKGVIILAIPMGGIPVALRVRGILNCPLDLMIVRKLRIPDNPEAGFGAMTQEGDLFLNEALLAQLDLTQDQIERQTSLVKNELESRNQMLRGERPFPELEGKTVVFIDDGLASGYTMKASVFMAAKRKAAGIVIAVPTALRENILEFEKSAAEIYCPNLCDRSPFAVADAYKNWEDLPASRAAALLQRAGAEIGEKNV
jgi:putative phosphoribosyl transferase